MITTHFVIPGTQTKTAFIFCLSVVVGRGKTQVLYFQVLISYIIKKH